MKKSLIMPTNNHNTLTIYCKQKGIKTVIYRYRSCMWFACVYDCVMVALLSFYTHLLAHRRRHVEQKFNKYVNNMYSVQTDTDTHSLTHTHTDQQRPTDVRMFLTPSSTRMPEFNCGPNGSADVYNNGCEEITRRNIRCW